MVGPEDVNLLMQKIDSLKDPNETVKMILTIKLSQAFSCASMPSMP